MCSKLIAFSLCFLALLYPVDSHGQMGHDGTVAIFVDNWQAWHEAGQKNGREAREHFEVVAERVEADDPVAAEWLKRWGVLHEKRVQEENRINRSIKEVLRQFEGRDRGLGKKFDQIALTEKGVIPLLSELISLAEADAKWRDLQSRVMYFKPEALQRRLEAALGEEHGDPADLALLTEELSVQTQHRNDLLNAIEKALKNPLDSLPSLSEAEREQDRLESYQKRLVQATLPEDFSRLLYVRYGSRDDLTRSLTENWLGNPSIKGTFDNRIMLFNREDGTQSVLYEPDDGAYIGELDLHYNADRLLFTKNHALHEIRVDGGEPRRVIVDDIDSADACYLPDGRIIFHSSAFNQGVPCIYGSAPVQNLHLADADGTNIRRLGFDQAQTWSPVVMEDGRVMFSRWEYTDTSHFFSRLVMTMNPDGTNQRSLYGSNSYWPNSIFFPQPIPGTSRFIAVVSGHHGYPKQGELVIFDPSISAHEAKGAVMKLPHYGEEIEPVRRDELIDDVWPRFLHPMPLSDDTFLVSCQILKSSDWAIYYVDTYGNLVPMLAEKGADLVEPIPVEPRSLPRIMPDRVNLDDQEATIYLADVYQGNGMRGVPRGTVDSLLVFEFHYNYLQTGGHFEVGYEGPWDVRVIHGRVPVEEDGSALFKAPANTPLGLQPLDKEGKSLQMHRSWFTAMPGEYLSCVGCHEAPREAPMADLTTYTAQGREPARIEPWYGPARGFSFRREVQPVLDRYCIGCHDGSDDIADLRDTGLLEKGDEFNRYSRSYVNLSRYVRRNGPEGDYHVLTPGEFHPDTSELVRLLEKGHHGVRLDEEAWDRLITWIDLNVPFHGTWTEANNANRHRVKERLEHNRKYGNLEVNYEDVQGPEVVHAEFQPPEKALAKPATPALRGWPFDEQQAKSLQGAHQTRVLDLGEGQSITLARIPAGKFVMGDANGFPDETPRIQEIQEPFWMAVTEISQGQFRQFDPNHANGYYDMHNKDQVDRGYPLQGDDLPVIRVSLEQALDYCEWLSRRTGLKVRLPTEAQWEWACRAGSAESLWWGGLETNFGDYANLADTSISQLAVTRHQRVMRDPHPIEDFIPAVRSVDDGILHLAKTGSYSPNPWGLYDMHGNVAEWTSSRYSEVPKDRDNSLEADDMKAEFVTRGGSWRSRPQWARAGLRMEYPGWQRVFDVGFRIIVEEGSP